MQALAIEAGHVALVERPVPEPEAGEALVRVRMAGVCNTDLEIARGYMGFEGILGHELLGEVEACADEAWIGRRVAGEINLACGHCEMCARDLGRHCPQRSVMGILGKDGCFAEYVTLPVSNLHELDDGIDDAVACFVEPTAAAFEILEQVEVNADDRIAVLGDGKLGLLVAQVLQQHGAAPLLAGRHGRKLELARARGIRTATPDTLPDKSFDLVVEATGSPSGMQRALQLTRPRGTLVLKSTYHGPLQLDAAPLVIDEISLVGSRCGPFEPALEALKSGAVDPRAMIDDTLPLSRGVAAFERAAAPGVLKVLLDLR